MELVAAFRVLWRRRIAIVAGAFIALALAASMGFSISLAPPTLQRKATISGAAQARVLVDTQKSLLANAQANGADTIVIGSILLGNSLATDSARGAIARDLGIRTNELAVTVPSATGTEPGTALSRAAIEANKPQEPYVVNVGMAPNLPLLSIFAKAPNADAAAGLAGAVVSALRLQAEEQGVVYGSAPNVTRFGPIEARTITTGPRLLMLAAVALTVFVLWCLAVVVLDRLVRQARQAPLELAELGNGRPGH